jgi:hypothetical protein
MVDDIIVYKSHVYLFQSEYVIRILCVLEIWFNHCIYYQRLSMHCNNTEQLWSHKLMHTRIHTILYMFWNAHVCFMFCFDSKYTFGHNLFSNLITVIRIT